ncbi:hypothetical protein LTR70_009718 [Exophiala xenobiotica]|uniref:Uncharacterized protein n=1 Tax=Lithohypha guttulata TaxID=1690604 RepID=A0ABR0JY00_9EURO|nr:hypothetical protein LTR24_009636 [Lithohypha guttulata]KAK5310128.1 hypothetical protein LTR70_009718 [Exophiala xenobiotica]
MRPPSPILLQDEEFDADESQNVGRERSSSPLDDPPPLARVDRLRFEQLFGLELGTREEILYLDREDRIELAMDMYNRSDCTWSIRKTAEYGVDRKMLKRRLDGGIVQEKLIATESIVLVGVIASLFQLGTPPTLCQLLDLANELLQRRLANLRKVHVRSLDRQTLPKEYRTDVKTIRRWVRRRPELEVKLARCMESKRAVQTCRKITQDFLDMLAGVVKRYHVRDLDI